jgi:GT2 family glycosyltransferase
MEPEVVLNICVIIPTFNRVNYLRIVLSQIAKRDASPFLNIIPVVVVDGSGDGTLDMLAREFSEVAVVKSPGNWWWTKSINEGIKYAMAHFNPDYFLLFNDDSQILPDYFKCLLEAKKATDENTIIGSISVSDTRPHKISFSGVKSINWIGLKKKNYYPNFELLSNVPNEGLFPTYALNGRGTFISTAIINNLGLLNEKSFPQYGSDDDLVLRAWKKGYKVLISYSCRIFDRTNETAAGTAFRKDSFAVFAKSFFVWHSVNYIPKQARFYFDHGIKLLLPLYVFKFIMGTCYAYFFKYSKIEI